MHTYEVQINKLLFDSGTTFDNFKLFLPFVDSVCICSAIHHSIFYSLKGNGEINTMINSFYAINYVAKIISHLALASNLENQVVMRGSTQIDSLAHIFVCSEISVMNKQSLKYLHL